jgi:phosphoribosylaminoimidazole-succinocarboxamide synthase
MTSALHTSALTSLPLLARGKVRDNYAVGDDRILMVASDRISAFDVIMGEPIPGKGELLTQMALFWFDSSAGPPVPQPPDRRGARERGLPAEVPQVAGRSMLVKRLKPIPVEAVVRGYLAGSGWKEYQDSQAVCGVPLPAGLKNASKLPEPIYTPAAKAEMGEHDENITFERTVEMIGAGSGHAHPRHQHRIYKAAADIALTKGIIIADTKFEFGLDRRRHAGADGRGADARFIALLAGRRAMPKAATRPATTSSSCATGWSRPGQRQALGARPAGAAPAARRDRQDRRQVPGSAAAADRLSRLAHGRGRSVQHHAELAPVARHQRGLRVGLHGRGLARQLDAACGLAGRLSAALGLGGVSSSRMATKVLRGRLVPGLVAHDDFQQFVHGTGPFAAGPSARGLLAKRVSKSRLFSAIFSSNCSSGQAPRASVAANSKALSHCAPGLQSAAVAGICASQRGQGRRGVAKLATDQQLHVVVANVVIAGVGGQRFGQLAPARRAHRQTPSALGFLGVGLGFQLVFDGQVLVQELATLPSGSAPMKPSTGWPPDHHHAGRDAADAKGLAELLLWSEVDLDQLEAAAVVDFELFQHRAHDLAGAAPGRPEVDQHGLWTSRRQSPRSQSFLG